MNETKVSVDLAGPDDEHALLTLNRLGFGGRDLLATRADCDWRMRQNPAGPARVPVLRNADGDVVGCIWINPLRIRYKGGDYLGATGTNLVIEPSFRNGLNNAMLLRRYERTLVDNGFAVHYSFVSEPYYQREKRRDPRTVASVPVLLKVFDAGGLAPLLPWPIFRGLAKRAGRWVTPLVGRRLTYERPQDITVTDVEANDARFDELWNVVKDRYPLWVVRDRKFMAWRFSAQEGRTYRVLLAEAVSEPQGYLVQRSAIVRGIRAGLVIDFVVREGPLAHAVAASLLAEAERAFRELNLPVAAAMMSPFAAEYGFLRQMGYHRVPRPFMHRQYRLTSVAHGNHRPFDVSAGAGEWFITIGDWEAY